MFDLMISLLLFFFCVALHLGICRRKKKDVLLIKLFLGISGVGLVIFWGASFWLHENLNFPTALPLSATMLYILLVLVYLSFYVNVKIISPSKKILTLIREQRAVTLEELLKFFSNEEFLSPRLEDLGGSGCVYKQEGRYRLSQSGVQVGRLLEIYQKILGRPIGG